MELPPFLKSFFEGRLLSFSHINGPIYLLTLKSYSVKLSEQFQHFICFQKQKKSAYFDLPSVGA